MPESLQIAMITPHGDPLGRIGEPDIGGQCVYIRELATQLASLGLRISIFTRDRGKGKPAREPIAPGAEVIRIACGPPGFIPKEEIYPYLDEFAAGVQDHIHSEAVIHSHFWDGGYVAGLLKPRRMWIHTSHSLGKRKLASLPRENHEEYRNRIDIETEVLQRCDAVIASTSLEKQDLVKLYDADEQKITVIPPGVDTDRFHPPEDRQALKRSLGLSDGPLVFTLGRLDRRKGFDLYFRAAAQVMEQLGEGSDVQFVLSAGASEEHAREIAERDRLQELLDSLGIADSVIWLPILQEDDIPRYYGAADVFVLPSRYELFGIVMLEAMACGVPVVATKFGGPPEVITDGENGCLVDPTNIEALAMAIADLIRRPEQRKRMGKMARKTIEDSYSWLMLAKRHRQLYSARVREV